MSPPALWFAAAVVTDVTAVAENYLSSYCHYAIMIDVNRECSLVVLDPREIPLESS